MHSYFTANLLEQDQFFSKQVGIKIPLSYLSLFYMGMHFFPKISVSDPIFMKLIEREYDIKLSVFPGKHNFQNNDILYI